MTDRMMAALRGLALAGGLVAFGAGCETQGPAEKAGEAVDDAARGVGDAIDPAGPMERAGEAADDAARDVSNP